jgi:DNA-binding CsgD family transcriptional regulator
MSNFQIVVLTESFVLNKGFQVILNRIRGVSRVDIAQNFAELQAIMDQKNVQMILVSEKLLAEDAHIHKIYKTAKDIRWGLITATTDELQRGFTFDLQIDVYEDEQKVLSKISQFVESITTAIPLPTETELSEREKEVLKQVALGFTNFEIGEKLFISQHTVIAHRKNITHKLGIKTISGLTVYAVLNNLIEMGELNSLK